MAYSDQFINFATDKRNFFANVNTFDSSKVSAEASKHDFRFLSNNRFCMEQEFSQLYAALNYEGDEREEYWLYCYYCCVMLERYYSKYGYDKPEKAKEYRKLARDISYRCDYKKSHKEKANQDGYFKTLGKKITTDVNSLLSTPLHTSQIRDWLGFGNIYRLVFVFSRLAVRESLLLMNELRWFAILEQWLGRKLDIDGMVSTINSPAPIFNALSLVFFASRLLLNLGVMLKHVFAPTEQEKLLSKTERFRIEVSRRHCVMLNDFVWLVINGLSNYAAVFHIPGPVAVGLTAGFLFFDVSLLIYRRYLAKKEYLLKKAQYISDQKFYDEEFNAGRISKETYFNHCKLLEEQQKQLKISWDAMNSNLLCQVTAAVLLMTGFSAALIFATPVGVTVGFIICSIAAATYLSSDLYGAYQEKVKFLQQCQLENIQGEKLTAAEVQVSKARNAFILAMVKNTIMPALIVTMFAINWPAAILLTVLYMAYESGYFKLPKKEKKPELLPLNEPAIEEGAELLAVAAL